MASNRNENDELSNMKRQNRLINYFLLLAILKKITDVLAKLPCRRTVDFTSVRVFTPTTPSFGRMVGQGEAGSHVRVQESENYFTRIRASERKHTFIAPSCTHCQLFPMRRPYSKVTYHWNSTK